MMSIANDASQSAIPADTAQRLTLGADRCVACGLCLKECPTYAVTRNETDSPRGRVMLMQALASAKLAADQTLTMHLERCLHCGRCERACPSNVPYTQMIDDAKALLRRQQALPPLPRWLDYPVRHTWAMKFLGWCVWLWQYSHKQKAARKLRLLGRNTRLAALESMLPQTLPRRRYRASGNADKGEVSLFAGCVGRLSEGPTLAAARCLIRASGFAVKTPSRQACCGALYQHNGDTETAQQCMRKNFAAFGHDTIVSVATGCGAHWQQAGARHCDIHDFLLQQDGLTFAPLDATVALHTPCTACAALEQADAPLRLLRQIPRLKVTALPDKTGCCGAGGAHVLKSLETGEMLIREKVADLRASGARMLLTSNTGCAMHFRRALRAQDTDIPVMHPIVLLCQQHKPEREATP